jgi:hypothetical protein
MTQRLFRLGAPLSEPGLIEALRHPETISVVPVEGGDADLSRLDALIRDLCSRGTGDSAIDAELVEPLHRSLRHLPEQITTDMRVWHWFCVVRYPELVWRRWRGVPPADPEEGFLKGQGHRPVPAGRFLGTPSINGQGRNTFARLFFAAERLIGAGGEDYELVRRLFSSQELHLGISDREYGLLPQVNRVLTRELADLPDLKVRSGVRRLNALGGSLCLDLLEEEEISTLVREGLKEAAG